VFDAVEHIGSTSVPGLIQELTDRARADRGLPPVPVWEE